MSDVTLNVAEAERQLGAALARHREAVAALAQGGRSAQGDATAAAAVTRGAALVTYALRRARAAGADVERLADVSEWEPAVVEEALERGPEPVLAIALPDEPDPDAVARARATIEAMGQVDELLRRISADVADPARSPTPDELDGLSARLEREWRAWREEPGAAR